MRHPLPLAALLVGALAGAASSQALKLVADDAAAYDQLGTAVSLSGSRLAVGSHFADCDDINTGAVYVWRLDPAGWVQEARIELDAAAINDQFGHDVALHGQTLLASTQRNLGGTAELTGSAHVFRLEDGRWIQEATFAPEEIGTLSRFGWSVDLAGDRAVVGAPFHSDAFEFTGGMWAFRRVDGRWVDEGLILPEDTQVDQLFGHDVAVSGNLAAASALFHGQHPAPDQSVYLFEHTDGAGWSQVAKLQPTDSIDNDDFGAAVDLDRTRVAISSPGDDDHGNASGSVYVYARGPSGWTLEQKITADDADQDEHFGQALALDGDTLVVGAIDVEGEVPWGGATYVFRWTGTRWIQQAKLTPDELLPAGYFGGAVAVDGRRVAGGAHLDNLAAENAGAVYVYDDASAGDRGVAADVR